MHSNKFKLYLQKLNGLTVFREILSVPVMNHLQKLLQVLQNDPIDENKLISAYGCFCAEIFKQSTNFSEVLKKLVLENENSFLSSKIKNQQPFPLLQNVAMQELTFFSELANFSSKTCKKELPMEIAAFLPDWENTPLDFPTIYQDFINNIPSKGYGIFAEYHVFTYDANGLHPVKHPDPQRLSQLTGYERETGIVLRNTEALLNNGTPSNLLLYGDAGTGKSSTIKAVANELKEKGLRLIEVKKEHLYLLPQLLEMLAENPLKFIIFIDDLSFTGNDEQFSSLKGILEGSVSVCAKNTIIYATSNRRHLVKESMDERSGNDIHLNDSLQEMMSLSARFGMTITFQKPDKESYLSIVDRMAKECGLSLPKEELFVKAEAFAIRQNGRSPRTAKHFVETQLADL